MKGLLTCYRNRALRQTGEYDILIYGEKQGAYRGVAIDRNHTIVAKGFVKLAVLIENAQKGSPIVGCNSIDDKCHDGDNCRKIRNYDKHALFSEFGAEFTHLKDNSQLPETPRPEKSASSPGIPTFDYGPDTPQACILNPYCCNQVKPNIDGSISCADESHRVLQLSDQKCPSCKKMAQVFSSSNLNTFAPEICPPVSFSGFLESCDQGWNIYFSTSDQEIL